MESSERGWNQDIILGALNTLHERGTVAGAFIWGAPGVGKTHVLHKFEEQGLDLKCLYLKASDFIGQESSLVSKIDEFCKNGETKRKVLIIDQYEILFRPPNYIEDRADAPREWGGWHHADDVQDMIKALRGFIEIKCESKETTIGQNFLIIGSRLGHHFKDHQLLVHAPRVLGLRRYVLGLMSEKEARKMVIEEIDDLSLVSEILQEAGLHPGLISHSIDKRKPNQTESYVAWREYEHYVHNLLRPEAEDQDLREKNILRLQALVWLISSQPKQLNSWMPIDEYLKHHQREELDFLSRSSIVAICDEGNAVSIPSGHLSVLVMQWYADYFSDYFRKHYSLHLIAQLALGSPLAISILVVTLMVILLKKPDVLVNLWVAVFGGLLALVLLSWSIGWFFTQKMIE